MPPTMATVQKGIILRVSGSFPAPSTILPFLTLLLFSTKTLSNEVFFHKCIVEQYIILWYHLVIDLLKAT